MSSKPKPSNDGKLFRAWCLWYLIPDRYSMKVTDWNDFLHQLSTFDTIDDMWAALNCIERSAQLPKGCRYYFFKKGVRPVWEDRNNVNGYEISIEHPIAKSKRAKITDRWLDLVLAVAGESISNSDFVNGVEFTVRATTFKISIWTSPCKQNEASAIKNDLSHIVNWKSPIKMTTIQPAPEQQ
ncbi:Eukaryotic initiation factor 4E family protein [Tritrichomonas foetus]|uniref:Eukaryotic initiation factor 4E family protein n=1 Tax=Tritrichomonas foetus TaxID=1144522 RepID=A0A1J4K6H3_9EUKA|nr:Eukaryotic initiation factor 4E family protein [Tritrichomonas foetus]|eukprot:OHT05045.1 Eukaryotic initiation factor 4E family protein [Tritrichomonas foetus]